MGKITLRKAFKKAPAKVLNFLLLFSLIVPYGFFPKDVFSSSVFPSTNEINKVNNWAHVNEVSKGVGEVTLEFVAPRNFISCFEYRTDGDTTQTTNTNGGVNYNNEITDGIYPFTCLNNSSTIKTINANGYVEIRQSFGDESDERFDWTRFDVLVVPTTPVLESPINNSYINDNTPLMQWEDSSVTGGTIKGYYYRIFHHCTDSLDIPASCSVFPNTTGLWRTTSEYQAGTTADGTYYWQVKSVDMNDNESGWSELEKFTIDTINPTKPVFTAPENNLYTNINFIKLEWTGGDDTGSGVKGYTLGYTFTPANGGTDKNWNTGLREVGNPYWHSGTYGHGEGKYVFWVKTIDNAGNESETSELLTVTYDKTAPSKPLGLYFWDVDNNRSIQCGGYSNTKHINEHWDATSDINFSHYEYSSFNAPSGSAGLIKSVFYTNYFNSSWWNIPTEGTYGFQVRTLDKAGNISPWALNDIVGIDNSCKITIDWTAPMVKIVTPIENGTLNEEVIIEGNVKDINLSHYNISIYDGDADVNDFSKRLLQNTEYTIEFDTKALLTWDTTSFDDGEYQIRLAARDLAGNRSDSTSIEVIKVIVDNTSPTIQSLDDFTINEGSTVPTKEVLVEDNYEIEELCYSITSDIGDVSETCISPSTSKDSWNVDLTDTILTELSTTYGITTTVADTSLIPEGDYTISYFAKDKAGNSSSIEEVIVTIVNVEPTVLFSSSITEIFAGNSITFNGSFIDPGLDDSNWTYTLSFGDGTPDVLGTLPAQGNILTNYSHTYTVADDYKASLKVCEDGGLICTTETIDISVGAVQGVTSESSTTTTNSPTLAKKVTTFFADILGVGGEGDALALENEEEILNEDTEEVKGSQTCDNPSTISGYIYIDSNNDGIKDEGERVFSEISIRVYTITDDMEETVKQLITDENGYWETTLCSGQYFVKVDDSKLPNNFVLGENDQEIQIEEEEDTSLDFTVLDERNFLQKFWPWILLAVGILGSIGIVALDTRRKKEYI